MNKITFIFILMLGIATQAQIIYTDIPDETLTENGTIDIDFNNDGTSEYPITNFDPFGISVGIEFPINAAFVMTSEEAQIAGLSLGTPINSSSNFLNGGSDRFGYIDASGAGTFPTGDAYIGAEFDLSGNTHYGWIKVNWDGNETFIVKEYAYDATPNTPINAGDTGTASVSDVSTINTSVYPNPFVNNISIEGKANSIYTIYDYTGKLILNKKATTSSTTIDLSELNSGVYILKATLNNNTSFSKLIKE